MRGCFEGEKEESARNVFEQKEAKDTEKGENGKMKMVAMKVIAA